ncbi:LysR family transcriptional regulator [Falsirhodobacter halotolerans]|uniref:LysR family transcriptional regulator n=1 Tax=Falsirhodobacter halotolerans TaxID=1146892 RepID=UPI001FCF9F87|nr:LysR family transcriptional regulator [Falsirhodobacter halotolerans]MCJ8139163.1 LysR family transcriptional regulator [Falsirhodobacter halotolerans]
MLRENITDLIAFATVARESSFTRAAGQLGVSQSALSHSITGLEKRLGLRLLTRTTRSVAPTDAGERLLQTLAPRLQEIELTLKDIADMREVPAGTIRLTVPDFAVEKLLWPRLMPVVMAYPDVNLEIVVDYSLTDIAADRFDGGVRYGDSVSQGMIAMPIGPDVRQLCVATPDYLDRRGRPGVPNDLLHHNCINVRLPSHGGIYSWEFSQGGRDLRIRAPGQLTFNSAAPMLAATLDGAGICMLPDFYVAEHLASGHLQTVLEDWCPPFPGLHLFYPSRRHS